MKSLSIRTVLLAGSALVLVALLGTVAWLGFDAGEDEAAELFDARLATSARVLAALVGTQAEAARSGSTAVVSFPAPLETAAHDAAMPLGHHYETKVAFQVLDSEGRLLVRSASAPDKPYAPLEAGFSTQGFAQHAWRVFTLRSGDLWVQAAERDDVRIELAGKLAWATVAPILAGVPLLLVLLALLVRYALRPLSELARLIERRQPESLAPVELGRNPKETAPIVSALNGLLERVRSALERERRFTADAAHELRTPLTALKVHAQNAVRASSEGERQASLKLMLEGLERAIRLAEQMLAFSRAAAARAPLGSESLPLREVVEEALEDVLPLVRSRGQRVALTSDPPVAELLVRGERDKLAAAARNLLDNASRYAPEGSTLRVELKGEGCDVSFSVVDQGPGIPRALRQRVFESYYRIPGARGGGGGLGLAIVREITAQHGGTVEICDGDGGRGTRVTVRLPAQVTSVE